MKIFVVLSFLFGVVGFAAEDLNYQLTQAAGHDNLQEAIRLLDLGADPLKHSNWNGWQISPALHVAAREMMKTGKDQVYKEFLRRGIPANGLAKLNAQSVWDYIFIWREDEDTQEKLERFFLRSLAEGADPFPTGPASGNLFELIMNGQDRVVSEIMNKGIAKTSWLLFTGQWAYRCENAASYPSLLKDCLNSFKKYFPVLKAQGIQIQDWGTYKYVSDSQPPEFQWPVVFNFVSSEYKPIQTELLDEFIRQGYDINFRFQDNSVCDVAKVPTIGDVKTLMLLGCQWSVQWVARALGREQFSYAQEILSIGGGKINEMFATANGKETLLTYFCSTNSEAYPILEWLLKNGANPNLFPEKGDACIHNIANQFSYYMKGQSDLKALKLLISYKADLNLARRYTPLAIMAGDISMGGGPTDEQKDYIINMGMETLLKAGANPNIIPPDSDSYFAHPFHRLAYYGITPISLKAINVLFKYNADPSAASDKHASIVHLLARHCDFQGCTESLEKAIKLAPDLVNQRGNYYSKLNTPLCLTIWENDNVLTAEVLLKHKADHKIPCADSGKTPYKTSAPDSKVRQVLEKFGINE